MSPVVDRAEIRRRIAAKVDAITEEQRAAANAMGEQLDQAFAVEEKRADAADTARLTTHRRNPRG